MKTITVYGFRGSPYVEKVIAALDYKGLAWSIEMMKTPAAIKRKSPITQKMPAIDIAGVMHYDSTFILRELEILQAEPALWSSDPVVAAQQRQLEDWCDESLYWYIMAMRWQRDNADKAIAQITSAMPAALGFILGKIIKKKLASSTIAQGLGRLPQSVLIEETARQLQDLSLILGDSPYFYARQASAADFAVYGQIGFGLTGTTPAFEAAYAEHQNLQDFYSRIKQLLNKSSVIL
ncbi:glutathione S-transferase family protein [Oceanicoccus sagamiensis]|uniref:GST C-terminal domain-containing protein n=1 Tax=Oceanicoccus sagamiensis TaxID=716816 RepID=A0A1X9NAH0_9GAMM|nr:glutathione S-transferase family protein [Oceanicoccus sagamiensis]ARN74616.1 hypothetical protein BST96_11080 [Oceanicoccus sagamiensis]